MLIVRFIVIEPSRGGLAPSQSRRSGGIEDDLVGDRFVGRSEKGVVDGQVGKLGRNYRSKAVLGHGIIRLRAAAHRESAGAIQSSGSPADGPGVSTTVTSRGWRLRSFRFRRRRASRWTPLPLPRCGFYGGRGLSACTDAVVSCRVLPVGFLPQNPMRHFASSSADQMSSA